MLSDEKLTFLTQITKGLAGQFGENCEVVIHQINEDNINNSIVSIENGHVSSRHLGDGPSQVVLEALKKDPSELNDHINYLTRTHDGRILKSSTMYFKDENGQLDGIFAINYDITTLIAAESNLKSLISTAEPEEDKDPDYIPQDVNELLDDLIHESVKLVGKPVPLMTKDDKIKCIQFLNNKGAFLVTKSGDKVSNFFNISKYTLYSYIDAK
ncbi:transcriptional regulator [Enterococcus faecalis]|uniref:helix-turn-helix transcriptional regulator n=1 Tax=Enterococcus faecalis TaxID=1351 RepID=UPI001A0DB458|nr:helix-turn-helix transcriptional regulator [Enterococcus faecalis]EGO8071825.1 transcriptional regulator [Enterococcus faecalis]MCO5463872.1 helix-turn-helix transcriptional regulator [Enterococcus faecalis]MCO5514996.1 helix-turn-helix transcriptional regulator [Enterococcus faecalis]MDU7906667.1 helix-turn-helix transcriptional regulator [Enterococcus faecalis]MDU8026067.1 helix-turn-helix transcriptional regulator [Enterococcus faecalis]